jgi:hypothetical protein
MTVISVLYDSYDPHTVTDININDISDKFY